VSEPKLKSFEISKWVVWEAYRRVKENKGGAGVDGESMAEFEQALKGNLYKLWNRLSSGSYFPPHRLSRIGSLKRSCACIWSPRWSRCFTRTPTGIGRGALRMMR